MLPLKIFLRYSYVLVILIGCRTAAYADALLDRVTAYVSNDDMTDNETFQLDIDEKEVLLKLPHAQPPLTDYAFVRTVHIACIEGCASSVKYSEQFDDIPIAAFCLLDGSPDLVTLWATGSAYEIRIYHVGHGSISKVLDQGSVTVPQIKVVNNHGALAVLLADPSLEANFPHPRIFQTWRWNGKIYQVTPRN